MAFKLPTSKKPKRTRPWEPPYEIRRNGETYVYVGDTPNTKIVKEREIEYAHRQGRKVIHTVDKEDKKVLCQYVSKKFYPGMCKELRPSWGMGIIGRK
jgi:hypothetical protein